MRVSLGEYMSVYGVIMCIMLGIFLHGCQVLLLNLNSLIQLDWLPMNPLGPPPVSSAQVLEQQICTAVPSFYSWTRD